MKSISEKMAGLEASASIQQGEMIKRLKAEGRQVIDLTWGEPCFVTDSSVINTSRRALESGRTKYSLSRGLLELRELIAERQYIENGLIYNPEKEIIITPGAKQAIFYALASIINPGDEIIVPEPYWLSYRDIISLLGGKLIGVKSRFEDRFIPDIEDIGKLITQKTKAVLLNTPVNPTGIVWDKKDLIKLCEIILTNDLYLISDEIYDRIVFDGKKHISPLGFPGMKERGILVNGFSKTYAMTGWRIGYLCASSELTGHIIKIHQHLATCSPEFVQLAAIEALRRNQDIYIPYVKYYQKARDILFEAISKSPSLKAVRPEGTFYMLVDISKISGDCEEAALWLLEKQGIATTPGSAYGGSASKTVRLSFAIPENEIHMAAETIRRI